MTLVVAAAILADVECLEGCVYHAARGFTHHLLDELPDRLFREGELVGASGPPRPVYWTRNMWDHPFMIEFDSVGDAARALRNIQRNWAPCPVRLHRRMCLIAERLPPLPWKPKPFPFDVPATPMGAFTLLDEHRMLAGARCSSPFPNGEFGFVEDHEGPPSRAYRKLWEAFTVCGLRPLPGDRCIDAGASPGGWTWALARLGGNVLAVDRAPLDPAVAALPGVVSLKRDAFGLKPAETGGVDWLFSDVICYPRALYDWILPWVESGTARNFICTIKMQGQEFDRDTTAAFASIPGSRIVHLWHNRHELTWILLDRDRDPGPGGS